METGKTVAFTKKSQISKINQWSSLSHNIFRGKISVIIDKDITKE